MYDTFLINIHGYLLIMPRTLTFISVNAGGMSYNYCINVICRLFRSIGLLNDNFTHIIFIFVINLYDRVFYVSIFLCLMCQTAQKFSIFTRYFIW